MQRKVTIYNLDAKVSHAQMYRSTSALYDDYDQRRIEEVARQAGEQDDAELKALENAITSPARP